MRSAGPLLLCLMLGCAKESPTTVWHPAESMLIEGRGWPHKSRVFDRLPTAAEQVVPNAVWQLSRHPAGICVHFRTDSSRISARWTLLSKQLTVPILSPVASSGCDLYVEDNGWRWAGVGLPTGTSNEAVLVKDLTRKLRHFMLYLPLYNGVESLKLGVDLNARLEKPDARDTKPIVIYGTSITHGSCAPRAGLASPAIVGRKLNREVINLGFSGSGDMGPEMVGLLGELDPEVFVLDCLPNIPRHLTYSRVVNAVRALRKARPTTPIVLAEEREPGNAHLVETVRTSHERGEKEFARARRQLERERIQGLHFMKGDYLDEDMTIDGSHPTGAGLARQAERYVQAIQEAQAMTSPKR